MGRVKPSRLNSNRTRTRIKAEFRAGLRVEPFRPVETPSEDLMFRLRQKARALLRNNGKAQR